MFRIYLDSCVYNRPFDDYQMDEKLFVEAMAFYVVLHWVENNKIQLISSDALLYECEQIVDIERKRRVRTYLKRAIHYVELSEHIIERARIINSYGFKSIDALHIAMAESGLAEYFVTCDNSIIKRGKALQDKLKVKVHGILEFLTEVIYAKNIE